MDLQLIRNRFSQYGIFGHLLQMDGTPLACTLEHAYPGSSLPIFYTPKLSPGQYVCVRGMHQLTNMQQPFEAFEITDVPGHTGILLHVGNFNEDSSGCVLLGITETNNMVVQSRLAFNNFMALEAGVESFTLIVA